MIIMANFNDVIEAHKVVEDAVVDAFSHRGMVIERQYSDIETKFNDMFIYVTVATREDGYQVYVKDENKQTLFNDPEARFASADEVVSVISESYDRL